MTSVLSLICSKVLCKVIFKLFSDVCRYQAPPFQRQRLNFFFFFFPEKDKFREAGNNVELSLVINIKVTQVSNSIHHHRWETAFRRTSFTSSLLLLHGGSCCLHLLLVLQLLQLLLLPLLLRLCTTSVLTLLWSITSVCHSAESTSLLKSIDTLF